MTKARCAFFIGFVPITIAAFDSVIRQPDEFEPGMQQLMGFARSAGLAAEAARRGGYDLTSAGTVILNY